MMNRSPMTDSWYVSNFQLMEKHLNGEAGTHIHSIRKDAISRFAQLGFPTTRDEEWKFTNVAPIAKMNFKPVLDLSHDGVTKEDVERFSFGGLRCTRLVFVNGHFSQELSSLGSLPQWAKAGSLAAALKTDADAVSEHLTRYARYDDNAFTALNTAFLQDGAFVYIPDGKVIEGPIHLLFISTKLGTPFLSNPRNLVLAGENSQVMIVESFVSLDDNSYLTNAVTEIVAGDNAVVEHDKLQAESAKAFHIGTVHVYQRANSTYTSNSISLGGALVRNNITVVLDGEGIECTLNGLSLSTDEQHVDNHTVIDHAKPHCNSHELYKSILDGRSKAVFNGKIFVRKDAQKTNAKQTNKTLLLSDNATIDTKPQLEIFANDVKCTHGATVGRLDEEQLFYLRSRGLSLNHARDVLTFAFASDIINRVHVEPLRSQLEGMIHARLQQGRH
ncbi:MAG: Fe-S cluster assembly protein SufD [Ignavibacteria bacterium]|nr:Fe-S cluster assembly protein SufD [Ignavibacteria bacterium]